MRTRRLSLLLVLATLASGCTDDRSPVPTAPARPTLATSSCELEHSEALTLAEIEALIASVTALETSGLLTSGQANALRGHLENAQRQIEAGRICAALAQIQAYEDQVAAWVVEGVLTPAQAETVEWDPTPPPPEFIVTINAPSPAAGIYLARDAEFGPVLSTTGVTGSIAHVNDGAGIANDDGCEPPVGFPAGSIALVTRGTCEFDVKVANAQAVGAVGVIVINNVAGPPTRLGGDDPSILIPSLMVSQADGSTILAGLPASGTLSVRP